MGLYILELYWSYNPTGLQHKIYQFDLFDCQAVSLMLSPCDCNIFNGPSPQSNVTKMYCDRIAKWIKFYWSTHKGLEGVVDLTGLRLPMATLDFVKPVPIHFGKSDPARKYGNGTWKGENEYIERWEWVHGV